MSMNNAKLPDGSELAASAMEYMTDAGQRAVLLLDVCFDGGAISTGNTSRKLRPTSFNMPPN